MRMVWLAAGLLGAARLAAAAGDPDAVVNAIVAVVNNEAITKLEVDGLVAELYRETSNLTPDEYRATWERAREALIDNRLLVQEARRRQVEVPPEEVNAEIERLEKAGLKAESRRDMIRESLMVARLLVALHSPRAISPDEVAEYYEKHQEDFVLREQRQVLLIVVRSSDFGGDRAAARKKADEVVEALKKGEDFGLLAKRHSKGPAADKGGDQGWMKKGALIPALDDVVFRLKAGEFHGPVESDDSYLIVKVAAVRPASRQSLAEARLAIERQLQSEHRQRRRDQLIERLRREASILRFDFFPKAAPASPGAPKEGEAERE
ncbi:MAG TPA: peptidyl-prolyl cis-trans isomerase [Planctomycetota bacterium]|nr:peptidyl-prolyl cis-trans isomerase [Planctomycetota bacterium]